MKRILFTLLLVCSLITAGFSQQSGHVNFGNLLSLMPGTELAQKQLQDFNEGQIAEGERLVKKLEADFLDVQKRIQDLTPLQVREYEAEFQKRQQDLLKFEQQISVNLEEKRQELLGPIIQRARDAINVVAKEKGYKMVFDSSLFNSLLFTEESTDLLPAIKAKLGIE